jgi:hypothetical protein
MDDTNYQNLEPIFDDEPHPRFAVEPGFLFHIGNHARNQNRELTNRQSSLASSP